LAQKISSFSLFIFNLENFAFEGLYIGNQSVLGDVWQVFFGLFAHLIDFLLQLKVS